MNLKTLDKYFSEFIRLRDANKSGYCSCISCGKLIHWKQADCGHFINRRHYSLRYNEKNCNAQCRSCNRFDEGNPEGYRRGLIKKHGKSVIDLLLLAKNQNKKFEKFEIDIMIKFYKQEVKKFKNL